MPTPTVRRLQLGNELRHLRDESGQTVEDAAPIIERTQPVISRLEHGQTALRNRDLRDLVEFYASHLSRDVDVDWYLELNRGNDQRGRWKGYRSTVRAYARMMVDLEQDANGVYQYQTEVIPGLLQTKTYWDEMATSARAIGVDQQVEEGARVMAERQQVLTKANAPDVGFVLSESALRRTILNAEVMREQIEHLVTVAQQRNVQLQVIPFNVGTGWPLAHSFTRFRIPSPGQAPPLEFVYLEDYHDAQYMDDLRDVETYNTLWNQLVGAALDPVESITFLRRVAREYD